LISMTPCLFLEQKRRDCLLINELLQIFCPVQRPNLLQFAITNMPNYHKEIEQNMAFISQSLDAFKSEVKKKFNIIVNLSVDEFIKLN
uniref:hypothetical protein n=1 Tax=Legionella geestiana TaxID=45065 RepID=UPI001B8055F7